MRSILTKSPPSLLAAADGTGAKDESEFLSKGGNFRAIVGVVRPPHPRRRHASFVYDARWMRSRVGDTDIREEGKSNVLEESLDRINVIQFRCTGCSRGGDPRSP